MATTRKILCAAVPLAKYLKICYNSFRKYETIRKMYTSSTFYIVLRLLVFCLSFGVDLNEYGQLNLEIKEYYLMISQNKLPPSIFYIYTQFSGSAEYLW